MCRKLGCVSDVFVLECDASASGVAAGDHQQREEGGDVSVPT